MNGNFIAVNFTVGAAQEFLSDLLMNELAAIGFDSFDANETGFSAYIPEHLFKEEIMNGINIENTTLLNSNLILLIYLVKI